ncbi:prenyltransferase [Chloroflexus islandicus]|uniref:Prenyltransferase n=1 Tax=Chloroflexus islandicus TaxID=1707952 RepID=A0A178LRS0_9CHLR|nr:YwiC-like family protein [Chloroflexus islandicus]OAN36332.1 prenyltransferase [Chloroflexus islandicus]
MSSDHHVAMKQSSSVRLRPIALPVEHGGWGLLAAPVALGLWLAPSLAGVWLGLAALGAFLTRQPLKLALGDYQRGKRYPRTIWAERFALGYGAIALIGLILAIRSAAAPFWLPIALAVPIALGQLLFDVRKQSRALVAELFGAVAISALAAAIMMADGWPLWPALLVWLLLAIQSVTAIIYVRIRLRLARNEPARRMPAFLWHGAALAIASGSVALGWAGWPVLFVFGLSALRCWIGLLPRSLATPTPLVGAQEIVMSLITVAGIALGLSPLA